ncbi:MAG: tetratricopeptide repeat protein, partial [Gemmataceae bacterium]|nr:tetratricopeptide repeat protein [Gemmataceae bacterium]
AALRGEKALARAVLAQAVGAARLHAATRGTLAGMASRAEQHEPAEKLYRACLEAGDLGEMETEAYAGLLGVLQALHKNEAVVALAKQGLGKAKKTPAILFHRALAYALLNLDRMKEALAAAEAAVAEAKGEQALGSRKLKAYVLGEMGRAEDAVEECRAMAKDYNAGAGLREARLALSRALQAAGRHDESEKELEKALESDPADATLCNDLGYGYADRGKKLEEAERLIRKAMELDKKQRAGGTFLDAEASEDNAAYVDSLGWALFKRGKLEEARKELERASRLPGGDDPVMWDHLGDVLRKLGKKAEAAAAWKRAAALYEAGARRKSEERHKALKEKLRQATPR